jgi:hypothetical protein
MAETVPVEGFPDNSNPEFDKAWDDYERLRKLMEAHGPTMHLLSSESICDEDPYFLAYEPLTLSASMMNINNAVRYQESIETIRKYILAIYSVLMIFTTVGEETHDNTPTKSNEKPQPILCDIEQSIMQASGQGLKLFMVIRLPNHVNDNNQIMVEFAEGSNSELIVWIPRGPGPCLKEILRNMPEINPVDASFYAHALEQQSQARWNGNEHLLDPYSIELIAVVDADKLPSSNVFANAIDSFALMILLDIVDDNVE